MTSLTGASHTNNNAVNISDKRKQRCFRKVTAAHSFTFTLTISANRQYCILSA